MDCRSERRGKWGWPSEIYKVGRETFWNRRKKERDARGTDLEVEAGVRSETDGFKDLRAHESKAGEDGVLQKAEDESVKTCESCIP